MSSAEKWEITDPALSRALRAATAAAEAGNRAAIDREFPEAVRLADPVELAAVIAARHVDALRTHRDGRAALTCCAGYRARFPGSVRLALLEAETRVALGDASELAGQLAEARRLPGPRAAEDEARRMRLEALAARQERRYRRAHELLTDARGRYTELGDDAAVAVIDDDLRSLAGRIPKTTVPRNTVPEHSQDTPDSTAAALARAETLRLAGRYELALAVVARLAAGSLDPALAYPVTEARVRLLRLLHRDAEANELVPQLYTAADASLAPERARQAAARLTQSSGAARVEIAADRRMQQVRMLVAANRLAEAEELLLAEAEQPEQDDSHEAEWQLAAGELSLAIARDRNDPAVFDQAVAHLRQAAAVARAVPLLPVLVAALRLLGEVHRLRGDLPAAVQAWAKARVEQERIAALQVTDETRIDLLTAVSDEFDEQIRVAAEAVPRDPRQVTAVAIAIEAARGAALFGPTLPAGLAADRELPVPGDVRGARAWLRRARRGLAHRQVVWLVHASTDTVHHVLLGRSDLRHVRCTADRAVLRQQVDAVRRCYAAGIEHLYERQDEFALLLAEVAATLGVDRVLAHLPRAVRRIAVVAGAELSDLPFGALPCPGDGDGHELLGRRYALSDLPCLAVLRPLRGRSAGQRGLRGLIVQPYPAGTDAGALPSLAPASVLPEHTVLSAAEATPPRLATALRSGYATVRIDSHGRFRDESGRPVLRLSPGADSGELRPPEFAELDLRRTGTLILGACDSGMQTRRGRDERVGFVRSGLLGGSAAVLAARWQADDRQAVALLDAFEDGLRRYPRDVALQRAVRTTGTEPVGWAAWTLYGDAGLQTRRGPLRRAVARWRAGSAGPAGSGRRGEA